MPKLAINGGTPIRTQGWPIWPVAEEREVELLKEVVHSNWSYNGAKETELRKRYSEFAGVRHTIAVANGTVSLQLCLEALDIGFGDEVIVPGLTWQATAACIIDVNAVPVFVDVEEDSWCIDPMKFEAAITPNTKAVIVVHLYGTICNMDAIAKIARKHHLYVIEDAAHQHGSTYKGKKAGNLGDVASFSLQNSKVFTCGEGGLITTNDDTIAERLDALRNCGRKPITKERYTDNSGNYVDIGLIQSGNYRITEFQTAILLGQLDRLPAQLALRDENAIYLNTEIKKQGLLSPMRREEGTQLQCYFNICFRYNPQNFEGLDIAKFRAALTAELNFPFMPCYQPLNMCELYNPLTKKRHKLSEAYQKKIDPKRFKLPVAEDAYHNTSICAHHKILLGEKSDMDQIAEAVSKIKKYAGELK